ncbi:MAG: type II toxin-antitoxin system PemK/MazF family toxin [Clostridia bacterium]|nr:type II toxin-antitoxin system PemK/MazF family toxin [Clostridia bacterium]
MEENVKRGDIYYVDFDLMIGSVQAGMRPVVVIQNDTGNKHSTTLIVATITSKSEKKRKMPTHIVINIEGLSKESIIQLEQITTIDKQQILKFVGTIPSSIMEEVDNAIKISLGLE